MKKRGKYTLLMCPPPDFGASMWAMIGTTITFWSVELNSFSIFFFIYPSSIDMLFPSKEKSKIPPMFLCFKVGKPMRKSFATAMTSSPVHSFGGRGKQPEYWFAVPQER